MIRFLSEARNDIYRINSVGLYANFYPVVLVKGTDSTAESLTASIEEQVRFIDSHTSYPYFKGRIEAEDRIMRFIYQKDIDDIGDFEELIAEEIQLDTDNDEATDSMCGVSVIDVQRMKGLLFIERYSKAHYDQESMDKLYNHFCEAVAYLSEGDK